MDSQLTQGLLFLTWSTAVIIILAGLFAVKVLFDLSRLTRTISSTAEIIKNELEPALKNMNETIGIVSKRVKEADATVSKVETGVKSAAKQGRKLLTIAGGGVFAAAKLAVKGIYSLIIAKCWK